MKTSGLAEKPHLRQWIQTGSGRSGSAGLILMRIPVIAFRIDSGMDSFYHPASLFRQSQSAHCYLHSGARETYPLPGVSACGIVRSMKVIWFDGKHWLESDGITVRVIA